MSDQDSNDDENENESEDETKEVNMAEFLMAQAEREMKEKKDKEAFDANLKKKLITKKRSDREYEEYWDKQKKGGGKEEQVNDAAVYRAYYSLKKNETLTQKLGGDGIVGGEISEDNGSKNATEEMSARKKRALGIYDTGLPSNKNDDTVRKITKPEDTWDYSIKPVSGNEVSTTGITFAALFTSVFIAKKISNDKKFLSFSSPLSSIIGEKKYYSSRNIKKDFTFEELKKSVSKSYSTEGFNALPDVPSSLANLKSLYGEQNAVDTLFKSSPKSLVTAVVYWRPSDAVSLRAVTILENLQRAFPSFLNVVTVIAPKYPGEGVFNENNGIKEILDDENEINMNKNEIDFVLTPSEIPKNVLIDEKLESWQQLGLNSWPAVLLCVNKGKKNADKDTAGNSGKIMFALENQRALAPVVGTALAAILSVIQEDEEEKIPSAENMWSNNLAAVWTGTPLIPGLGAKKGFNKLNRPMRITFNNKNGLLYVSDTGNHRVLEVSTKKEDSTKVSGTVQRIFGSSGVSGIAAPGTTIDKMQLNKPMGLAIDYDNVLYIADSGNDVIRRVQLEGNGNGGCVTVGVARPDVDADGSTYDVAEISDIERELGKNLVGMRETASDELFNQMTTAKLMENPLASQLIGRTRPLLIPTDVAISDAFVYISAAGSRQIWRVSDGGFTARPVYGSGMLGSEDCQASATTSFLSDTLRFAQPAGIVGSSGRLFVVDNEACTLRAINLIEGYTKTVLGQDGIVSGQDSRLLEGYGDVDTSGFKAKTQV
jgi:hypothetical protein